MTKLFITIVLCVIPFTTFAQINLGQIFEKAEKGDARAQYKLGEYYLSKKNYQQAILWLQKLQLKIIMPRYSLEKCMKMATE